jgi:hypothetical protein
MLVDIVVDFRTGKRVSIDMCEDFFREHQQMEPRYSRGIHRTRYFTLIEDWKSVEMLGFFYGVAREYVLHPRYMHAFFRAYEK